MTVWSDLLANLAIVALATSAWTFAHRWLATLHRTAVPLGLGVLMSVGTFCAMLLPIQFTSGVLVDLRYTFIGVAGFFGGPIGVLLPFTVSIVKRLISGGTGVWVAVPHILLATGFGLVGHWRLKGRQPTVKAVLLLSFAVVFSGTVGFFVMIPVARWPSAVSNLVAPFAAILFASTFFSGIAILQELKRQATDNANRTYRAIIEALPDCLNAKDLSGAFIAANPATAQLMGAESADNLIGKSDFDFYPATTAAEFRQSEEAFIAMQKPMTIEQRFTRLNGAEAWLSTLKAPLYDEGGKMVGLITHNREITEQRRLEATLKQTQQRLAAAVASMADGLAMFDADGVLVFHNSRYHELFPLTSDIRVPGVTLERIIRTSIERGEETGVTGESSENAAATIAARIQGGDRQIRLDDGRWLEARTRPTEDGGWLILFADITTAKETEHELRAMNERLGSLAHTDGLTGLLNRRSFDLALEEAMAVARNGHHSIGLLMIDVDHFKAFNDRYGHLEGDTCLQAVSNCIARTVASVPGSITARYGGEEFTVVLPFADSEATFAIAELVRIAVRQMAVGHAASDKGIVTVSVGVTTSRSGSGRRTSDLIMKADLGLYAAKAAGRDCVQYAIENDIGRSHS